MNKPGPLTERFLGKLTPSTMLLDETSRTMLGVIGAGNLSRGTRRAARVAYERHQVVNDVEGLAASVEPDDPAVAEAVETFVRTPGGLYAKIKAIVRNRT